MIFAVKSLEMLTDALRMVRCQTDAVAPKAFRTGEGRGAAAFDLTEGRPSHPRHGSAPDGEGEPRSQGPPDSADLREVLSPVLPVRSAAAGGLLVSNENVRSA